MLGLVKKGGGGVGVTKLGWVKGWGGWGDNSDRHLCLSFAKMYHSIGTASPL